MGHPHLWGGRKRNPAFVPAHPSPERSEGWGTLICGEEGRGTGRSCQPTLHQKEAKDGAPSAVRGLRLKRPRVCHPPLVSGDGLIRDVERNLERTGAVGVEVMYADAQIDLAGRQIEGQEHGDP